ncbi:acetate kinase [archaeon]|nr:acetate kinase [archaeon]
MDNSLVINAGSSSIKFQVFEDETSVLSGLCDAIGLENSKIKIKFNGEKEEIVLPLPNHKVALEKVVEILKEKGLLNDLQRIIHRAVHGGETFKETAIVTDELIKEMEKLIPLAPLHNPANIEGMKLMKELLPDVKEYAVFDTAFHSTMQEKAYLYPVPYSWYKEHGVRRYGFHGSSHQYVIGEALKLLNNPKAKIISCHLGNGASVCAADSGISVDTSMGMTPLEGVMMGTRSGTIDPGIIEYMMNATGRTCKYLTNVLNKESGLKGVSELTSDMRPLEENMETCEKSKRAMGVYLQRLTRLIGSHIATLGGVDAIVFTGGAGEKSPIIRAHIANQLKFLGIELDKEANDKNAIEDTTKNSKVKIFTIPTDEELQMVRNAKSI